MLVKGRVWCKEREGQGTDKMLKEMLKGGKQRIMGMLVFKKQKSSGAPSNSGQTPLHIAGNITLQIALILAFVFGVSHEVFPKIPDVKDYPVLGEPGGPLAVEAEPVIPFKRYPPGYDVFG